MSTELIRIDLPPALNAESIASLHARVAALQAGCVAVLRGTHEVFCRGMDFGVAHTLDERSLRQGLQSYADLLLAIRSAPCAMLAAVEGGSFGGGVGLAAACDVVLASSEARFGLPEALHGFYPAIVFAVMGERVAPQKARQLALLCESVSAADAQALGLVDVLSEPEKLEMSLQRLVRRLQRAAPAGVLGIKQHVPHLTALRAALAQGVEATLASLLAPGVREALTQEALT